MSTKYERRSGTRIVTNNADAEVVGRELEKFGSVVEPEVVVKMASRKKHPLHRFFEWDDGEAAKQHRIQQARQLINAVVIVHEEPDKAPVQVRAFVKSTREGGGYQPVADVMSDSQMREVHIQRCWQELQDTRARYNHLTEFASVWRTIPAEKPAKKSKRRRAA